MYRIIFLLCSVFILAGCAVDTYVNRYVLNSVVYRKCCGGATSRTLLVSDVTAAPGYDSDQILYLKCPYELKFYSKNRWAAPPNQMLTTLLNQSLVNTCYFRAVVIPPFAGVTNYHLQTRLIKLQQEFFCCPSRVRMVMQAVLVNSCTNCPIAAQTFTSVVLAPQNNVCGAVSAANQAARCILQQITSFVICHINNNEIILDEPQKYKNEEVTLDEPQKYSSLDVTKCNQGKTSQFLHNSHFGQHSRLNGMC